MERFFTSKARYLLAALLAVVLAVPALAEEKKSPEAAKPKEKSTVAYAKCDEGTAKCKPLKKDDAKYARCMKLICVPKSQEDPKPQELSLEELEKAVTKGDDIVTLIGIGPKPEDMQDPAKQERTCEVGLRKCNALRELGDRYWLCMDETCSDEAERKKDPFCQNGKKECYQKLADYRHCVSLMCKSSNANCAVGVEACSFPLAQYWDCVSGICLGSTDEFKDPERTKKTKYPMVKGPDGELRRLYKIGDPDMPVLGVADEFAYPPPGITQQAWQSRHVPHEVKVTNDLVHRVECRNRAATITCSGDHIGSCLCSDGTRPATKEQIARDGYQKTFSGGQ